MSRPEHRTAAFRRFKAWLMANDVPCMWCGQRATTPDHLVPVALGGGDDDLVPACYRCNIRRGGRLGARLAHAKAKNRRDLVTTKPSRPW